MNAPTNDVRALFANAPRSWKVEILIAVFAASAAAAVMRGTVLGVLTIVATLVLAAFRVDAVLYLFIFFLPFAPLLDTNLPIRDVFTFLRIALFGGVCLGYVFSKNSLREWFLGARLNWMVIGYGVIALLSVLAFSEVNTSSQRALLRLVSYLGFYFVVVGWVKSRDQVRMTVQVLLLSTVIVALFGIYQATINGYSDLYFRLYPLQEVGIQPWVGRVSSFLFHFNSLAGYLNIILPFAFACALLDQGNSLRRLLGATCFALGSITLILTQSRGGLIAFGGTVLLAIWFFTKNRKIRLWSLVSFPIVALIAIWVLGTYAERLSGVDEFTTTGRLMFFAAAFKMFLSSPIIGVGYGNFRELYGALIPDVPTGLLDSHNLYLQLLSETGIIGFAAFFIVIVGVVRLALRQFRNPRLALDRIVGFGALGATASVLVHGFTDFLFETSPQFGALFWLILGLLVANERLRTSTVRAQSA